MTTQSAGGAPAKRVKSVTSPTQVTGNVARRVIPVTDGRAADGGAAEQVYYVSTADLVENGGRFTVSGEQAIPVINVTSGAVRGGSVMPVYDVTGQAEPNTKVPGPVNVPALLSAEIGSIDASTIVVIFDRNVSALNYSTGVTIKVNGTATSITSATQQTNHAIVHYVIPVLWHGSSDVVTWEYDSATGNIISEIGSAPLDSVTAQTVTNSCEYGSILGTDIQSDSLVLNDGDPVSDWPDQTPGGTHSFSQSGAARPVKQTKSGYPVAVFDGFNSIMIGGNWADNLPTMTILIAAKYSDPFPDTQVPTIYKMLLPMNAANPGWAINIGKNANAQFICADIGQNDAMEVYAGEFADPSQKAVWTCDLVSLSEGHIYFNGSNQVEYPNNYGTLTDYSTTELVKLGLPVGDGQQCDLYAVLILSPRVNATNRAALETRLGARYGLTVP